MVEVDRLEYIITAVNSGAIKAFKEVETSISSLSGAVGKFGAGNALSAIESGAGNVASKMQSIGIAASVAAVPITMLASSAVSAFAELESQITRDTALLGGGAKEYQALLDLSKELGNTTPFNTTEIASGIESLAAAGYTLDQIKAAMGTVTEMSIAAGEPLEAMSDILVNVLSQFGAGASDAEHFADVLAVGANESTASISDMGNALKYAGNMSGITNKSIEEFSAALTVLANNGLKGTIAGTGLVSIMGDLANPKLPAQGALEEMGLTKKDIDPSINSMEDLLTTLHDAKPTLQQLYQVFGNEGTKVIAPLITDKGLEQYKKYVEMMVKESDGANKRMADTQRGTLQYAMSQISESYQKIQLAIGEDLKPLVMELNQWLQDNGKNIEEFVRNAIEGLTPLVEKLLDIFKGAMEWFNNLPDDMRNKIASFTGIGAALTAIGGPLLLLGSIPVAAIGKIAGVLKLLFSVGSIGAGGGLAGAAGEVSLLTTALATLGTGTALVGVAAVAAGIAAYTTNFGDFRDNINSIISDIGSAASNISTGNYKEAGRDCGEAFADGIETAVDLVAEIFDLQTWIDADKFCKGVLEGIEDGFEGMGESLRSSTDKVGKEIVDGISAGVSSANSQLGALGPAIIEAISAGISNPEALAKTVIDGFNSANVSVGEFTAKIIADLQAGGWAKAGDDAAKAFIGGFKIINPVIGSALEGLYKGYTNPDAATDTAGLSVADKSGWTDSHASQAINAAVSTGFQKWLEENGATNKTDKEKESLIPLYEKQTGAIQTQTKAIQQNTDATEQATDKEPSKIQDVIKGFTEYEDASRAAIKAGYSEIEAMNAWESRFSSDSDDSDSTSAHTSSVKKDSAAITEHANATKSAASEEEKAAKKAASAAITLQKKIDSLNNRAEDAELINKQAIDTAKGDSEKLSKARTALNDKYERIALDAEQAGLEFDTASHRVKDLGDSASVASGKLTGSSSGLSSVSKSLRDEMLDAMGFTNHGWMSETDMQNAIANGIRDGFPGVSTDLVNKFMGAYKTTIASPSSSASSGIISQSSDIAFSSIKQRFAELKQQFDTGAISQAQYLDGLRKASAETDTLSRSTNTLKGEQKTAVLEFEQNIKESLRRIEAGKYGTQPAASISDAISKLTGSTAGSGGSNSLLQALTGSIPDISKATAVYESYNKAAKDGITTTSEAYRYLNDYNAAYGKQAEYTRDQVAQTGYLMQAMMDSQKAQTVYSNALADGKISADERTRIDAALSVVTKDLGAAGITAKDGLSGLPQALQGLASYATDAINKINSLVGQAEYKLNQNYPATPDAPAEKMPVSGGYTLDKTATTPTTKRQTTAQQPNINLNIDMRGSKIDQQTASDLPRQIARASRLSLGRLGV